MVSKTSASQDSARIMKAYQFTADSTKEKPRCVTHVALQCMWQVIVGGLD